MPAVQMTRFGFRIRTRNGSVVDHLSICGRDMEEAERKLRQMYMGCEILDAKKQQTPSGNRVPGASYEDVMNLITAA